MDYYRKLKQVNPNGPKHGDKYYDPHSMDVWVYDQTIEKWFLSEYYSNLENKKRLTSPPPPISPAIMTYPINPGICERCGYSIFFCICEKEKPLEDFGLEDELFEL